MYKIRIKQYNCSEPEADLCFLGDYIGGTVGGYYYHDKGTLVCQKRSSFTDYPLEDGGKIRVWEVRTVTRTNQRFYVGQYFDASNLAVFSESPYFQMKNESYLSHLQALASAAKLAKKWSNAQEAVQQLTGNAKLEAYVPATWTTYGCSEGCSVGIKEEAFDPVKGPWNSYYAFRER